MAEGAFLERALGLIDSSDEEEEDARAPRGDADAEDGAGGGADARDGGGGEGAPAAAAEPRAPSAPPPPAPADDEAMRTAAIEAGFAPLFLGTEFKRRFEAFLALRLPEADHDRDVRRRLANNYGEKALLHIRNDVLTLARSENARGRIVSLADVRAAVRRHVAPSLFAGAERGVLDVEHVARDVAIVLALRGVGVETADDRTDMEPAQSAAPPAVAAANEAIREAEAKRQLKIAEVHARRGRPARVCVVGAGPSGLACALSLQAAFPNESEVEVVVLEARTRPGGRVCTMRPVPMGDAPTPVNVPGPKTSTAYSDELLSVPVDLGAMLVTGTKTDIEKGVRCDPSTTTLDVLGRQTSVLSEICPLFDPDPNIEQGSTAEEIVAVLTAEKEAKERRERARREQPRDDDGVTTEVTVEGEPASEDARMPFHRREVPKAMDDAAAYMFDVLQDEARAKVDQHPDKESGCINENLEAAMHDAMEHKERLIKAALARRREEALLRESLAKRLGEDTMAAPASASAGPPTASFIPRKKDPSREPKDEPGETPFTERKSEGIAIKKEKATKAVAAPPAPAGGNADAPFAIPDLLRRLVSWHRTNLEYGNTGVLRELSLPHWNQDEKFGGFAGPHEIVSNGYGTVTDAMAARLRPGTITYNAAVTSVAYGRSADSPYPCAVEYRTAEGAMDATQCDAVVLTVPLGVLKRCCDFTRDVPPSSAPPLGAFRITPPLPTWKADAVERLGMGRLDKVFLEWGEDVPVFWDDTVSYFGVTDMDDMSLRDDGTCNTRGQCFMFWNVHGYTRGAAKVLAALVVGGAPPDDGGKACGHTARDSSLASEVQTSYLRDVALQKLRSIFGSGAVPDPVRCVASCWSDDPFARGAYSYVRVGSFGGTDYDILSAPVGTALFFAGEHTSKEHLDTVGGAILSGQREAARVELLLRKGGVDLGSLGFPAVSGRPSPDSLTIPKHPEEALRRLCGDGTQMAVGDSPPFVEPSFWTWCGKDYTTEEVREDDEDDMDERQHLSDSDSELSDLLTSDDDSLEAGVATARPAKRARRGLGESMVQSMDEVGQRRRSEAKLFRQRFSETGYDGFGGAYKPRDLLEMLSQLETKLQAGTGHAHGRLSAIFSSARRCSLTALHAFFADSLCAHFAADLLRTLFDKANGTVDREDDATHLSKTFELCLKFVGAWKPWSSATGSGTSSMRADSGIDSLCLDKSSEQDVLTKYLEDVGLVTVLKDIAANAADPEVRDMANAIEASWAKSDPDGAVDEAQNWEEALRERQRELAEREKKLLEQALTSEAVVQARKAVEQAEALAQQAGERRRAFEKEREARSAANKPKQESFAKFMKSSSREEDREARRQLKAKRKELKARARAERAAAEGLGEEEDDANKGGGDAAASAAALAAELADEGGAKGAAALASAREDAAASPSPARVPAGGEHKEGDVAPASGVTQLAEEIDVAVKHVAKKEIASFVSEQINEYRKPKDDAQARISLPKDDWKEIARKVTEKVLERSAKSLSSWAAQERERIDSGKARQRAAGEAFRPHFRNKILEDDSKKEKVRALIDGYVSKYQKKNKN